MERKRPKIVLEVLSNEAIASLTRHSRFFWKKKNIWRYAQQINYSAEELFCFVDLVHR